LVERRLKGPWINLKKQLALPYEGSFLVIPPEQIPCDLRLNVGIHLSSQGTDPFAVKVNILLLDLGHHDFRRRCRSRAGRMFRAQGPNYQCNDDQTNHSAYNETVSKKTIHGLSFESKFGGLFFWVSQTAARVPRKE
jgi:hypothetical protein